MSRVVYAALTTTFVFVSTIAHAADPAVTCESGKLKASGKYALCLLAADAKAVKTGDPADYSKCDEKLDKSWTTAETKGMGMCPGGTGDQADVQGFLDYCGVTVAEALANGGVSTRLPQTGQTTCSDGAGTIIACAGTGQDGDVLAGAARSFTDNGDGTITDHATGLMWEKLGDDGSIHDKDNQYSWTTAFSSKIATLNAMSFAGHNDWRLPNYLELQSLINTEDLPTFAEFDNGCIGGCAPAVCSCTVADNYWTSTTSNGTTRSQAYTVRFTLGLGVIFGKGSTTFVRAVRSGS